MARQKKSQKTNKILESLKTKFNSLLPKFNKTSKTGLLILVSVLTLFVSVFATYSLITRNSDTAKAAPIYTCPSGGSVSGTNCVAANKTYSCPQGGSVSGSGCVPSASNPIVTNAASCPSPSATYIPANPNTYGNVFPINRNVCHEVANTPYTVLGFCEGSYYSSSNIGRMRNLLIYYTPQNLKVCATMISDPYFDIIIKSQPQYPTDTPGMHVYIGGSGWAGNNIVKSWQPGNSGCFQYDTVQTSGPRPTSTPYCTGWLSPLNVTYNTDYRTHEDLYYYAGYNYNDTVPATGSCPTGWTDAGGANCQMPATPNGNSPSGVFDGVSNTGLASGWAFDPDVPSQPIGIHLYINGPAGSGTFLGATTTDQNRPDVNQSQGITGNHGFAYKIPAQYCDGAAHDVYAYGLDAQSVQNSLLTGSPKSFSLTKVQCATIITGPNVSNSNSCNNTLTIAIPNTYNCIFPLTGDGSSNYTLPSGGLTASTSTATGNSDACSVDNGYVPMTTWFMNRTSFSSARFLNPSVDKNWFPEAGGDFNKDGNPDLVWHNQVSGQTVIWLMDANQNITSTTSLPTFGANQAWSFPAIGDFDGDGNTDMVWRNQTTGLTSFWKMNGTTFVSATNLTDQVTDINWVIEGAGDFNGDGKADLFWHNHSTGQLVYWYMNGITRTSSVTLSYTVPDPWFVRAVADFSGDGKPDLLWHNGSTAALTIWSMDGTNRIADTPLQNVGAPWYPWGSADFNKDGKADILWRQYGVDGTSVLRCNNIPTTGGTTGLRDVVISNGIGDKGDVNLTGGTVAPTLGTISGGGLTGTIGGPAGGTVTTTGGNYNGPANYTNGSGCTIAGNISNNVFTPSANVGSGCPTGTNTSGGLTPTGTGTLPPAITTGVPTNFTPANFTITGPNIGTGSCSPASVNIGGTTTCTYPLVNIPSGQTPVLPSGGVTDQISTATGTGSCAIGSNNTTLVCSNVPTTSGTAGPQTATPSLSGSGTAPITLVASACTNGATNPPACDTCPSGQVLVNAVCVSNCTNGTNNPPACNQCPTGQVFQNNVCATIITPANISNSSDCTTAKTVIIPNTYLCTFPLTGDPGSNYALPTGGIQATTSQNGGTDITPILGGYSPDCTILGSGTGSPRLECRTIPTQGGTEGVRNVPLKVAGGSPVDRGDVTLSDGNFPITGPNIGTGTCFPPSINIGSTTTCTYPLVNIPAGETPILPTGGVTDAITTATGNGNCAITGATSLVCTNLPSSGGTAGPQSATPSLTGSGTAPITLVQSACTNGAVNPPDCNVCPSSQTLVIATCVANCTNGATNPPACNQCPTGQTFQNNMCVFVIDGTNIGAGTCTPASVNIGVTVNCTYPLINIPNGQTPGLPSGGVTDSVSSATGSTPCTITGTNLVCNNVPTTGGTAGPQTATPSLPGSGTAPVTLTATVPTITCNSGQTVLPNSTTTCTYTLPDGTNLTPGTQLGIGDATPAGTCTQAGQTVTCTGVPTGSQTGVQPIKQSVNGSTPTDTGSTVTVGVPTITCNNGQTITTNSTTTCTFTLPTGTTLTPGTQLGIGNATPGGSCSVSTAYFSNPLALNAYAQAGTKVTCTGVPTGSLTGQQTVYIQTPGSPKTDSGSRATVADPIFGNTVRTGALSIAILGLIAAGGAATGVYLSSRSRKLKVNIKQ